MTLRPYQIDLYRRVREAFREVDRACMQLPTGGGKTRVFAEMARVASSRGWNTWIMVPRNELLEQSSDTLLEAGVKHGRISATSKESAAYDLHVVSKDTLARRIDAGRVKRAPQLLIVDECHLALDRQIDLHTRLSALGTGERPMKVLGVSATPERLDGRGLSELYQALVVGPTIPDLVESGHLSTLRYYAPAVEGIQDLHRRGTDFDGDELDALLKGRKVYGSAIEHYRRHADRKPALVFCRSVKAAEETAALFSASGYRFENVDGTMTYTRRKALIDGLRDGRLDGVTSCELITYGLDVPRVECVIMLRPTLSRTLFFQMVGRGLRPWPGKSDLIVLDHVGNLQEHGHPFAPHTWNFEGRERRKREKADGVIARLCPEIDFLYCDRPSCVGCPHAPADGKDPRKPLETVDASLTEIAPPVKLAARPADERMILERRIGSLVARVRQVEAAEDRIDDGAVGELLALARELGNDPMWVYHRLSEGRVSVNVTLLCEIGRQLGYKRGWAWFKAKELRARRAS